MSNSSYLDGKIKILFVSLFLSLYFVSFSTSCDNDSDCLSFSANYSQCDNGTCRCWDYFVYDIDICVKMVPYGKKCSVNVECSGLGEGVSRCNKTQGICTCGAVSGEPVEYEPTTAKCYKVKELGTPCIDDIQCILGSNEFARCVNTTCVCVENDYGTFEQVDNLCYMKNSTDSNGEGDGINLSVFAVTASISAALFVIIFGIFQLTRPQLLRKNKKTIIAKT